MSAGNGVVVDCFFPFFDFVADADDVEGCVGGIVTGMTAILGDFEMD